MYLTAYLFEELARIAQQDRSLEAGHSGLVRVALRGREAQRGAASIRERLSLAIRPTATTCQSC